MDPTICEVVAVALHLAEDLLDVGDQSLDVVLATCDLEVVNMLDEDTCEDASAIAFLIEYLEFSLKCEWSEACLIHRYPP